MQIVLAVIAVFLVHNYNKNYIETKDPSIKGFLTYMKKKYLPEE